jgi:glycosyltransferase involved in cell wall biosynthesis
MPKVSLIIPNYNTSSTIQEAINSALNQSHKNIEIIVVDDGSTDDSVAVIQNNYPQLKLITQENSGPSAARNAAAKLATGEYLVFLDSDDLLHPNYVAQCLLVFQKNQALEIVYSDAEFFGAKTGLLQLGTYTYETFLCNTCIPVFAMLKKATFFAVGAFDPAIRYAEDWDLWLRIVIKGGLVHKINATLYYYRKRLDGSSLTDQNKIKNAIEPARLQIYNKYHQHYINANLAMGDIMNEMYRQRLSTDHPQKYYRKYYNVWYRKLTYRLFKPKRYQQIYKK